MAGSWATQCAVAAEGRGFKVKRLARQVEQEEGADAKEEEGGEHHHGKHHEHDDDEILSESDSEAE